VNRAILRRGGRMVRQRGSHRRYEASGPGPDGMPVTVATIVAQHPGDIPSGTLRAIEKDLAPVFGERWLTK
jgi:predicted RNA binding protein YcfA (HicA-like mRNA interferase family)